jgi:hypothetical protein
MPSHTDSVLHGYGYTHGFCMGTATGTSTGRRILTRQIPVPVAVLSILTQHPPQPTCNLTDDPPAIQEAHWGHSHQDRHPNNLNGIQSSFTFFPLSQKIVYSSSTANRMHCDDTRYHQEHRKLPQLSGESPHPR